MHIWSKAKHVFYLDFTYIFVPHLNLNIDVTVGHQIKLHNVLII